MATSTIFNNYAFSPEQNLLEDLVIESIRIHGLDFYYLPRTLNNFDPILGQDDISSYDEAVMIEMYVADSQGFSQPEQVNNIMSKLGLQINPEITFTVAKRVFDDVIGRPLGLQRPNESDLIYYPLNGKCFKIMFVDNKPIHYPLGTLPVYNITCQLFDASNEQFNTGITEIDTPIQSVSTNQFDYALHSETGAVIMDQDGNIIVGEQFNPLELPGADNDAFLEEQETSDLIDFSETDPFAENWQDNL